MKTLKDINVAGKRVFLRVDLNAPVDENGKVGDDTRIRAVLPAIQSLMAAGAKVLLASHLGRPKGKPDKKYTLAPVAARLEELLGRPVPLAPDCVGPEVQEMAKDLAPGGVLLLENLRFHPEEEKNDDAFAKELAALCDIYVNNAFAVSHRANSSVEAIVRHAPVSAAGPLLEDEVTYFHKAMDNPERPLVAVVGGAKISGKLETLQNMLKKVDVLVIGGAMANTFLKAQGLDVGASLVEDGLIPEANAILAAAKERGVPVYLPVDAVAAEDMAPDAPFKTAPVQAVPKGWKILDIGPATALLYGEVLADAKTIIWNGPMGVFEMDAFAAGTMAVAGHVAGSKALSIVGGGDTDAAVHKAGVEKRVTYVSTGGGAFLEMMEGKTLPGVAALE
jgi:phosphoglycerate kinase